MEYQVHHSYLMQTISVHIALRLNKFKNLIFTVLRKCNKIRDVSLEVNLVKLNFQHLICQIKIFPLHAWENLRFFLHEARV